MRDIWQILKQIWKIIWDNRTDVIHAILLLAIAIKIFAFFKEKSKEELMQISNKQFLEHKKLIGKHSAEQVYFSNDGKRLITASKGIKFWCVNAGKLIKSIEDTDFNVISFDEKYAANGYWKYWELYYSCKIYDTGTRKEKASFSFKTMVNSLMFSLHSKYLAVVTQDFIEICSLKKKKEYLTVLIPSHMSQKNICTMTFAPDEEKLLIAFNDNTIKIYCLKTGRELKTVYLKSESAKSLCFRNNNKFLIVTTATKVLYFSVESWKKIKSFHLKGFKVISPDGKTLLNIPQKNFLLEIWSLEKQKKQAFLVSDHSYFRNAAIHPNNKIIATINGFGEIELWKLW